MFHKQPMRSVIFTSLIIMIATSGLALPEYEATTLPFPERMDEGDQYMAKEVLKLSVYRDSEDPLQYYYVPPFHVRQYQQGAASMMLHAHNIKNYAAANNEMQTRSAYVERRTEEYTREHREYLRGQLEFAREMVTNYEAKVEAAKQKLADALMTNNPRVIELFEDSVATYTKSLSDAKKELELLQAQIKNGDPIVPPRAGRGHFERALLNIANTGLSIPHTSGEDPDILEAAITKGLEDLAKSYGGFLSLNAYGGFTRAQIDALTTYKHKYMPDIKVSLLPIEGLSFFPLTEVRKDPSATTDVAKIFTQVKGAGDYLGTAIVLDTSIAGAMGLAQHMAPFILPIGIEASLKQKAKAFEAVLSCDFSTGFSVKGRSDIRDGAVIFDNDISLGAKAIDHNQGACDLKLLRGDQKSAQFAALQEMEKQYENMKLNRTGLAQSEKSAYYRSVIEDVQHNRRDKSSGLGALAQSFIGMGWAGLLIDGLSQAADFHWHTNIQDVSNLSTVKFSKNISWDGYETVSKEMAPNLCLVYNAAKKAYDRCTEAEEKQAKDMMGQMVAASSSEECSETSDPFQCGKNRDQAGSTARRNDYQPTNDFGLFHHL